MKIYRISLKIFSARNYRVMISKKIEEENMKNSLLVQRRRIKRSESGSGKLPFKHDWKTMKKSMNMLVAFISLRDNNK